MRPFILLAGLLATLVGSARTVRAQAALGAAVQAIRQAMTTGDHAGAVRIADSLRLVVAAADSRTSTTGEIAGDDYVYIGNSQIDRMNAGTIDPASMDPIRIYRVPIRP